MIPVIIPVNPSTLLIEVIFSVSNDGSSTITCGGVTLDYPKPGFFMVAPAMDHFLLLAFSPAVFPLPTPIVVVELILF